MIHESLSFLAAEVNKFLNQKLVSTSDPRLKIGNAARALDASLTGVNSLEDKAILSLVNLEEDRIARQHENFTAIRPCSLTCTCSSPSTRMITRTA
jgi:hypothetical protein